MIVFSDFFEIGSLASRSTRLLKKGLVIRSLFPMRVFHISFRSASEIVCELKNSLILAFIVISWRIGRRKIAFPSFFSKSASLTSRLKVSSPVFQRKEVFGLKPFLSFFCLSSSDVG